MENILLCERAYLESFSQMSCEQDYVEFTDDLLKDMYDHNFIYVPKVISQERILEILNQKLEKAKETGFCKAAFAMDYELKVMEELSGKTAKKMSIITYGRYLLDIDKVDTWNGREDCTIKKLASQQDIKDVIQMGIEMDGEILGEDFCTRRVERKAQVYINNENIDDYLIYYNNELVGYCEAFTNGKDVKIEDLCVLPRYQKRGFATTLLEHIVRDILKKDIQRIFLDTDEEDTVKEMYMKLGFSKIGQQHMLMWAEWME